MLKGFCSADVSLLYFIFLVFNGQLGDQVSQKALYRSSTIFRMRTYMNGHDQYDLLFAIAE